MRSMHVRAFGLGGRVGDGRREGYLVFRRRCRLLTIPWVHEEEHGSAQDGAYHACPHQVPHAVTAAAAALSLATAARPLGRLGPGRASCL